MIIRFGNHQIESDPLNITLYKIGIGKGEKNKGQETKSFIGNFDSIGHMLRYCTKYHIRLSEAETLEQLAEDIARIEDFIDHFAAQITLDIRKVETDGSKLEADTESECESGFGETESELGAEPNY